MPEHYKQFLNAIGIQLKKIGGKAMSLLPRSLPQRDGWVCLYKQILDMYRSEVPVEREDWIRAGKVQALQLLTQCEQQVLGNAPEGFA